MTGNLVKYSLVRAALVGLLYSAGAWVGATQTVTPYGLSLLWPANAILLAALLVFPRREWHLMLLAALVADIAMAEWEALPIWAIFGISFFNLAEALAAAVLIRFRQSDDFDFFRLESSLRFFMAGPVLASAIAALPAAAILATVGWPGSSYLSLWRLWWFGDLLGLLLLTPPAVMLWRWLERGAPRPRWEAIAELLVLWLIIFLLGMRVFSHGDTGELEFHLTPILLFPFALWAAIRLGVHAASLTVALIAALAIGHLARGFHPYGNVTPQYAVWLTQEYLGILAVVCVGLATLLHQIRRQGEQQELCIEERTISLERANAALNAANRRLQELVSTDDLTGIANRRHFYEAAERVLQRLKQGQGVASLIMFDLDNFKSINDRFGHEAGDNVLKAVGNPVRAVIRAQDLFSRLGGEEFVILLPGANEAEALAVAERIRAAIELSGVEHAGQRITYTSSFGVAAWDGSISLDHLISSADRALYIAKDAGRNCVRLFSLSA